MFNPSVFPLLPNPESRFARLPAVSSAVQRSLTTAEQHLPCIFGGIENRSIQVFVIFIFN
jgi:hypothetical protein